MDRLGYNVLLVLLALLIILALLLVNVAIVDQQAGNPHVKRYACKMRCEAKVVECVQACQAGLPEVGR